MPFTDDPIADFNRHDRKQAEWLRRRPMCAECGQNIQGEKAFLIYGDFFCKDCIEGFEVTTEDYLF